MAKLVEYQPFGLKPIVMYCNHAPWDLSPGVQQYIDYISSAQAHLGFTLYFDFDVYFMDNLGIHVRHVGLLRCLDSSFTVTSRMIEFLAWPMFCLFLLLLLLPLAEVPQDLLPGFSALHVLLDAIFGLA